MRNAKIYQSTLRHADNYRAILRNANTNEYKEIMINTNKHIDNTEKYQGIMRHTQEIQRKYK